MNKTKVIDWIKKLPEPYKSQAQSNIREVTYFASYLYAMPARNLQEALDTAFLKIKEYEPPQTREYWQKIIEQYGNK